MAAYTVVEIAPAGVVVTPVAVALTDTFTISNDGRTFLMVVNGSGGSIDVGIAAAQTTGYVPGIGNLAVPAIAVAVAGGATKLIGPISAAYAVNGVVTVTYSSITTITAKAFHLPSI